MLLFDHSFKVEFGFQKTQILNGINELIVIKKVYKIRGHNINQHQENVNNSVIFFKIIIK